MAEARVSIDIARPVDEVFDYLAHYENNPSWQDSVVFSRQEGEPGVGSVITYRRMVLGRAFDSTVEMVAFEPGRRIRIATRGDGPFRYGGGYDFEACAAGTRLTYAGRIDVRGVLGRMAGRVLVKGFQRQMEQDLANLKRLLET